MANLQNYNGRYCESEYYHCFIGRVFYMTRELERIEMSESVFSRFCYVFGQGIGRY